MGLTAVTFLVNFPFVQDIVVLVATALALDAVDTCAGW
jgi:hypothetical protein